jgi:hypothetical protein
VATTSTEVVPRGRSTVDPSVTSVPFTVKTESVVSGPSVAEAIDALTGRKINKAAATVATLPRKRETDKLKALPSQES